MCSYVFVKVLGFFGVSETTHQNAMSINSTPGDETTMEKLLISASDSKAMGDDGVPGLSKQLKKQ